MDVNIDFNKSFDENFTIGNILTIRAMETIIETGKYNRSSYSLLDILSDDAGITFGKNQTTENGGGLYKMIKMYTEDPKFASGSFVDSFDEFLPLLYGSENGKINALKHDDEFKKLLVNAAENDSMFIEAQRKFFHVEYFKPMYELSKEWDITIPIILMMFYDLGIHSGPKYATKLIDNFDKVWKPPSKFDIDSDGYVDNREYTEDEDIELERRWGKGLIENRMRWLLNFTSSRNPRKTALVRSTSYRARSILSQVKNKNWELELPFKFDLIFEREGRKPRVQTFNLTEELVREVELS